MDDADLTPQRPPPGADEEPVTDAVPHVPAGRGPGPGLLRCESGRHPVRHRRVNARSAVVALALLGVLSVGTGCGVPASTAAPADHAVAASPPLPLPGLPHEPYLTADDLAEALPGTGPWGWGIADYAVPPWVAPWCTSDGPSRPVAGVAEPGDARDEFWSGGDPLLDRDWVELAVARWEPSDGAGEVSAAAWLQALREDSARCDADSPLDAAGAPGDEPFLTGRESATGIWVVRAATTDGPTGIRVSAGVSAASAEEAGAAVAGLLTTALGRLASADDLAGPLADHPASRPALTTDHLPPARTPACSWRCPHRRPLTSCSPAGARAPSSSTSQLRSRAGARPGRRLLAR